MKIFREKPGIISEDACWVGLHDCYLYVEDTLVELLVTILTEWKHDRHLVG